MGLRSIAGIVGAPALALVCAWASCNPVRAANAGPELGRPMPPAEVSRYATVILPDGTGLPPGSGSVEAGRQLYLERCSVCHGEDGRGGPGGELAGGEPDLTRDTPDQTIGSYWPFATTLFDFIRRAMPMDQPWSLTDDEVYALTAYLLRLNGIAGAGERIDAAALARVVMPNRRGFVGIDAPFPDPPPIP